MRSKKGSEACQRGLTIIELVVALAIGLIVIGAVYRTFSSQQRIYTIQDQVAEAQQNARVAMNILMRDLRMAGYGKPGGDVQIRGEPYRHSIEVKAEKGSDVITLVGCFGSPKGYLTRTADKGETQIEVRSTGNELSQIFRADASKYIFIGGVDKLAVDEAPESVKGVLTLSDPLSKRYPTGVLSEWVDRGATEIPLETIEGLGEGDVLFLGEDRLIVRNVGTETITIDTKPEDAGNQGISKGHPKGTFVNPIPVYRLTALVYSIEIDDSDPRIEYLSRNDKAEGDRRTKLAEYIQKLEVPLYDPPLCTIEVTARTRVKDPDYGENEGYRTRTLKSQVRLRNL